MRNHIKDMSTQYLTWYVNMLRKEIGKLEEQADRNPERRAELLRTAEGLEPSLRKAEKECKRRLALI
jgi:hypothetical protein